ncbi:recombinase family protein [Candidatus Acetothermia bacterium]|nr:recombinase family protein [Candidatus Acetothermia bacterium]
MMKFIGYIRVSTIKQSKQFSLENQREAIRSYCNQRKFKLILIENESKSAIRDRPVFDRVFREVIDNRNVDGIIVAKLDRMGRSVKDLATIGSKLQESKKQLVSVHDNLDTSTPNGRLLFNLLAAIAEYERELLMERTKAGRERAAKQGVMMHRPRIELDLSELKSLYLKEVPIAQLARVFNVHKDTIRRRLDEMKLRKG